MRRKSYCLMLYPFQHMLIGFWQNSGLYCDCDTQKPERQGRARIQRLLKESSLWSSRSAPTQLRDAWNLPLASRDFSACQTERPVSGLLLQDREETQGGLHLGNWQLQGTYSILLNDEILQTARQSQEQPEDDDSRCVC